MTTSNPDQFNTKPSQILQIFINLTLVSLLISAAAVLLIAVYHTLIYMSEHLWSGVIATVLPAATFALALGVIFSKQAVHSLLCLISIFFNTVILYLYTGAEFLAFLFLIVYVGAIAILFLFVIMLLHLKKPEKTKMPRSVTPFFVLVFGTCVGLDDAVSFSLEDFFTKSTTIIQRSEPNGLETLTWYVSSQFSDIWLFSDALYRANVFLFSLVSLLLLTAMLGAIVLATSTTDEDAE